MPGRLAIYDDEIFKKDIQNIFENIQDTISILKPKYNIAPTIEIPIFLNNKVYTYAHFGLIPSWAKDKKTMNINGRSETLFEKSSFRESFKNKRCLIPINGYYEWKKDLETKQSIPYHIHPIKENYFALAGLWDEWYDSDTNMYILSCALITTEPNNTIAKLHDRMPVILDKKDWKLWLDETSSLKDLNKLFKPCDSSVTHIKKVSTLVNNVKNDNIECIVESKVMEQRTLF